jgi:hypothetical protein
MEEGDKNTSGDNFLWLDEYSKALREGFFRTRKNKLFWLGGAFLALFWLMGEIGAQVYTYQQRVGREISFNWKVVPFLVIIGLVIWLLSVPIRQRLIILLNFSQIDAEKEKQSRSLEKKAGIAQGQADSKDHTGEEYNGGQKEAPQHTKFHWKSLLKTDWAVQKRIIILDLLFIIFVALVGLIAAFPSGVLIFYGKEAGMQAATLLGLMFFLPIFLGAFLIKRVALIKSSLLGFLRLSIILENSYLILRFNFTETTRIIFFWILFYLTQGGAIFLLATPFFWILESFFTQLSLAWFDQSSNVLLQNVLTQWEFYPALFVGAFFLLGAVYLLILRGFFVAWELDFWLWWIKRVGGAKKTDLVWEQIQQQSLMKSRATDKEPASSSNSNLSGES